ncbi:MAG: paraquat-inducible protein A [Gammaproteobacteria bacterium]
MAGNHNGELIACHECDHLHRVESVPAGARASCRHCSAVLYKHIPDSLNRSLAFYLSALFLFIIANSYPFLSLKIGGRIEENLLITGGWALYKQGMGELGLVVFLTSIAFPFTVMVGMVYLLGAVRLGYTPRWMGSIYRLVQALTPWSLIGVFMLGALIAFVKLQDLATVIPGTALYAFAGLLLIYSAARASFDPRVLWSVSPHAQLKAANLRPGQTLLNCHTCALLRPADEGYHRCPRCGTPVHQRIPDSIDRTWALVVSAAILLIPANVYPVMTVIRFGKGEPDTILSGVLHLIEGGMWGLALIVFFASIVVPVMKLIVLSFLLLTVRQKSGWRPRDRTLLYRVTEVVGAWSMVDVYLVGLLTGLVSLGALSTIQPGIGAVFFAGVVILTMFAAHSFDPRLIWDNAGNKEQRPAEAV